MVTDRVRDGSAALGILNVVSEVCCCQHQLPTASSLAWSTGPFVFGVWCVSGVCVWCCPQVRGRWQLSPAEGGPRPLKVTVRRSSLLEDAVRGLATAGTNIKTRLQVPAGAPCTRCRLPYAPLHAQHGGILQVACAG